MNIDNILAEAPDNFVIRDALCRCLEVLQDHKRVACSLSGGADSDVMLDMLLRCGAKEKTDFVFFNTGLEYAATLEHIVELENKYAISISTHSPIKPIPLCVKQYGVPFWSKYTSEMIYRLQLHNFEWEDEPYEVLIKRYPKCISALKWWCDHFGTPKNKWVITYYPSLKEFMLQNPPTFKISNKCCTYAKKRCI